MTAADVFSISSMGAMLGWLILAAGVATRNDLLRDQLAGLWWPAGLSGLYFALIVFFFGSAPGGFDSLANVKLLFTSDWVAVAGWVHYLAFDLLVGSWIARELMMRGFPRLVLVVLLPLTFLFGPIGYLVWQLAKIALKNPKSAGEFA